MSLCTRDIEPVVLGSLVLLYLLKVVIDQYGRIVKNRRVSVGFANADRSCMIDKGNDASCIIEWNSLEFNSRRWLSKRKSKKTLWNVFTFKLVLSCGGASEVCWCVAVYIVCLENSFGCHGFWYLDPVLVERWKLSCSFGFMISC